MTAPTTISRRPRGQSPYDYRLGLVVAAIQEQTDLDGAAAREAAVSVLHAIDTIPEYVR